MPGRWNGPAVLLPHRRVMLGWGECQTEHRHVQQIKTIATMGMDIGIDTRLDTIAMTLDIYGHLFPRHDDGKELAAAALLAEPRQRSRHRSE